MTPPEAWYEQIVGHIVASKGRRRDKQRTPTSFVAPNARDRRSFSVIDNRRGENSSPCRMGFLLQDGLGDAHDSRANDCVFQPADGRVDPESRSRSSANEVAR